MDRPDLVIEWTHRLLASLLILTTVILVGVAFRRRREAGVGGPGGVLRSSSLALGFVVAAALLGAVTVWLGNTPLATVAHKVLALALLATLAATVVRAGGFGGAGLGQGNVPRRTARTAVAAAGLALVVVALGALTAKTPGATGACLGFPLCNGSLFPEGAPAHVQMTHRLLAYLLVLHVLGMAIAIARRTTEPAVRGAAFAALALVLAQVGVAAGMVLSYFPMSLRSLHQAVGVSVWVALFLLAYLARRAPAAAEAHSSGRQFAAEPLARGAGS
jgi:heme A synthase